ncbi:UNVERIFIED_CONTAM: hypothetical protein FKN15_051924 [Acipenser sinensis]
MGGSQLHVGAQCLLQTCMAPTTGELLVSRDSSAETIQPSDCLERKKSDQWERGPRGSPLVKARPRGVQSESDSQGSAGVPKVSPGKGTAVWCPADPTGQASSELRADTCMAGLCPPEGGSSLASTLEFLGVEEEAGSVVGSEDAH